ncbi:hypothetical protein N9N99_01230 [Gammaproteobacteria bacterium]|nr:hypothetical protein [Gammaproteobacteria bacterium]
MKKLLLTLLVSIHVSASDLNFGLAPDGIAAEEWLNDGIYLMLGDHPRTREYKDYGFTLDNYPLSLDDDYEVIAAIRCDRKYRGLGSISKSYSDFIIWGRGGSYEYLQILYRGKKDEKASLISPFMKFVKEDSDGILYFKNFYSFQVLWEAMKAYGGNPSLASLYDMQTIDNQIQISSINLGVWARDKTDVVNIRIVDLKPKYCSLMDKTKVQRDIRYGMSKSEDHVNDVQELVEKKKKF